MNAKPHPRATLALFSLIVMACSIPGLIPGSSPASGGGIYDENGQPVALAAPPQDFMTVLNERQAAGEIGEAEALIAALKLFAGEDPGSDPFAGQEVEAFDGAAIFGQAAYFMENSDDQEAKTEIERLLRVILPLRDNMDRFARPADGGGGGQPRPVRPAPAGDEAACRALWKAGFPADAASLVCLLYHDFTRSGQQYRIYYPESQRSDPGYVAYVQASEEALRQSLDVYSGFTSTIDDIDIVFTLIQPSGRFGSSGDGPRAGVPVLEIATGALNRCTVLIYPAAFRESLEDFRQVVAHEVFHCFSNWRQGFWLSHNTIWYGEAMANYFSNLVYPANNLEFRFQPRFDYRTLEKSVFHLSYENTIFFQYLGNTFGEQWVFDLLDVFDPWGSHEDHARAMVAKGLTQQVFQEFAQAYVDLKIDDSGGGAYPIKLFFREVLLLRESRDLSLEAEPFQVSRYLLVYTDEGQGEYKITPDEPGLPGRNIAQRWPDPPGPWRPLPIDFTSRCGSDGDRLVLTTVEYGGTYELKLDVMLERTRECDCIIGTWVQDTPEIESHLRTLLPGGMRLVSLSGQFLLVIDSDGRMTFTPQDYRVIVQRDDGPEMEVSIAGIVTSTYELPDDAPGTIVVTAQEAALTLSISVGGVPVALPLGPEAFVSGPFAGGGSFQYDCNDTTLTAIIPPGLAPFPTSSFQRVSEVPPTPIPDETVDAPDGPADDSPLDTTYGGGVTCPTFRAEDFAATGNRVRWTLSNSGPAPIRINAVSLNWPEANGPWTRIELDGVTLWTGSLPAAPARVDDGWSGPSGSFVIAAEAEADLVLTFAGAAASPSSYVLIVDLEGGCIVSDVR